jgi:mono/diheme cytochrome c family protein
VRGVAVAIGCGIALACGAAFAATGCDDDGDGARREGGSGRTDPPAPARERPVNPTAADFGASPRHQRGADAFFSSGCLGCHRLRGHGNAGPGQDLSRIGARMSRDELVRALVDPTPPMPSYAGVRDREPRDFEAMVEFLADLR